MKLDLLIQMVVPCTIAFVALYGIAKKVDVYGALVEGAGEGLKTALRLIPVMAALMTAVSMLRASGILEWMAASLAPVFARFGVPPETVPLLLVRPISGSAALGLGAALMEEYGPDSTVGRTAAVMLGASETTFYTIAVYFGAAGVSRTRYAVPAALCADLAAFLAASWTVEWLF